MHNWWYVQNFCRSSRDLSFPDKILQGVREEKSQLKDLWIFSQTNYHLNWGFPHAFFIAYFILSVSISSVKIVSISADSDFPPLRNYIFKRRNLLIKYVIKYKNRLYTSKYNWKDLKELFPSETLRPLRDDDFTEDLTQGEKFFGIFYNIFRGNSGKNFNFHFNNIIFIHVWLNYCEKAINTSKQSFHVRSFIASYSVCPVAILETCVKTQRSDYWQLINCFCVCIWRLTFCDNLFNMPYSISASLQEKVS